MTGDLELEFNIPQWGGLWFEFFKVLFLDFFWKIRVEVRVILGKVRRAEG